jgi:hypothetical protein
MGAVEQWRNRWRRWLGEREPRAMPAAGPKPAPGAKLVSGRLRITVQSGLSDELWELLVSMGWREETFRPDRRRYEDVPRAWVLRLYQAAPHERQRILRGAIGAAKGRNPTPPALY